MAFGIPVLLVSLAFASGINRDALLIKTDSNGNELWNTTFGGSDDD